MNPDEFRSPEAGKVVRTMTGYHAFVTTITRAAKQLGVTAPTARTTIDRLVRVGMLREATGREWGRTWLARPILNVVNGSLGKLPKTS